MQFDSYISDLLYRYECVIIPDFGAFLTHPFSAQINKGTHTFYPPKKELSFNEQLKHNDGLLANYIANVENLPYETVVKKITQKVASLKSQLAQGETLIFKNIGGISANNNGNLTFEPSYHLNYLTDAFGLTQFVSIDINREVYKKQVETIEKVVPITITAERRTLRPYLRYAAIALIALTLGGFMASNYYVAQIEQHNQLAQEEANAQLENKIQEATFIINNTLPAITLNVAKQSGNYHIVAGAFRVEKNSTKKLEQLRALGYNARKIGQNKFGLHEVIYASYENGTDALTALRIIRRTNNKDAWLKVDAETNEISNKIKSTIINDQKSLEELNSEQVKEVKIPNEFEQKSPNIIQIIKNVKNAENGFYLVFDVCKDTLKRDVVIKELVTDGEPNIDFFFDGNSGDYFIYNEKFNNLDVAIKSLKSKENTPNDGKMFIVKIEN